MMEPDVDKPPHPLTRVGQFSHLRQQPKRRKIRPMEVKVTYELDGEIGAASVIGAEYETARDEAFDLVPDSAQRTSIRVDREQ